MLLTHQQQHAGALVVALRGEAGVAEAQTLTELIIQLAATRPPKLIFDLSRLTFISSLATGELAALAASLRTYDCRLGIAGAPPMTLSALHRVRLDHYYEMFDSVELAISQFTGTSLRLEAVGLASPAQQPTSSI